MKMLPDSSHERPLLVRVSFTTYILGTLSLPLFGLVACVFISSVFHFEDATGTHCQVPNYLPSISASISLSPESHIWRFCIGLHSAPRILVAFTYFRFYKACFPSRFPESPLSCVTLAFSVFVHKEGFVLFIISSFIYMLTTCRLWKSIKKHSLSPKVTHFLLCSSILWFSPTWPSTSHPCGILGAGKSWSLQPSKTKTSDTHKQIKIVSRVILDSFL
ncbi:post-GPI attachment to proteins factor 2-like isoform X4 [Takifugu flavidus]|uniref:post-GPI attachment to proteins factor 2-like isoform X4 n=1 Tax=Takifugu flavidus TaxID=433684 RepID=UPI0025440693|nr:post-GPI attachment to proteins factor 2-like isoform X4 [Takifugu flavidus]